MTERFIDERWSLRPVDVLGLCVVTDLSTIRLDEEDAHTGMACPLHIKLGVYGSGI